MMFANCQLTRWFAGSVLMLVAMSTITAVRADEAELVDEVGEEGTGVGGNEIANGKTAYCIDYGCDDELGHSNGTTVGPA